MSDNKTLSKQEAAVVLGVPVREVRAVEAGHGGTVATVKAGVKHLIRPDGSTALVNREVDGYPTVPGGEGTDDGDGPEAQPAAHAAIAPGSATGGESDDQSGPTGSELSAGPRKTTGRGGR